MRITADTNLLVRAITADDAAQTPVAQAMLDEAEVVALTLPTLCELAWVLRQGYKVPAPAFADMVRTLIAAANVRTDVIAVEAGLAMLDAGGDFADGVIAYEGQWLGGETFVSFDRKAVGLLRERGAAARLLA